MIILSFPPLHVSEIAGPEETKNPAGGNPPPDSDPFSKVEFRKNVQAWQGESLPPIRWIGATDGGQPSPRVSWIVQGGLLNNFAQLDLRAHHLDF